uniref:Mitochondrial carrier protein n=1 Tax=Odontella aurita TaxID=265563 RepID=A0A7S4IST9_9STRA|mmetsp:Transcript_29842/g.88602  ORF Transcript_29842/g.88602 Transcript_29842/m.88602 type:complete len:502 (+) Transcript_29842:45-1550(+)
MRSATVAGLSTTFFLPLVVCSVFLFLAPSPLLTEASDGSSGPFPAARRSSHALDLVVLGARRALSSGGCGFGGDPSSIMSRDAGRAAAEAPAVAAPPAPAAVAKAAAAGDALRRRFTLSAGGSRKINQKVSSDELFLEEQLTETATVAVVGEKIGRKGSIRERVTEAESKALKRMKTEMERNHRMSSFLAGIGSGVMASVFCAPLDLIRTRMQVMGEVRGPAAAAGRNVATGGNARIPSLSVYRAIADIVKEDGFRGCFRGLGATLATVPLFWGIYFPLYEELKRELHRGYIRRYGVSDVGSGQCPAIVHMGSAIMAGAVADTVCNPMFLVRTRMQTEALHYFEQPLQERRPHGVVGTIRSLYAEGGVPVFWRGLTASLMGLSHVAIQFPVYEFLKAEARADSPTGEESASDLLLASGVAKMCASLVTYPHEVIRSRMMDARGPEAGKNVFQVATRIVGKEGYLTLYTGLHVSLLRVVPNCCITFMSYELILRWAKEHATR